MIVASSGEPSTAWCTTPWEGCSLDVHGKCGTGVQVRHAYCSSMEGSFHDYDVTGTKGYPICTAPNILDLPPLFRSCGTGICSLFRQENGTEVSQASFDPLPGKVKSGHRKHQVGFIFRAHSFDKSA